ncbi:nuclear transport factor 2 family protein [Neptuniibacter halophilus]|uniref:nuclear transport factor 2 family protein n=1 Tax=Neptuniibacter halophilus TaxID=651666 RepID=UPI002573141B|nr:nuclear transport factor 2 family protein [Neptuniibacter halophilus]
MANWLEAYISALEALNPGNVDALEKLTSADIEFRDPFNLSQGRASFIELMADMFERLDEVEFRVDQRIAEGHCAMIHWRFSGHSQMTGAFSFQGMSRIEADSEGLIRLHHDYWDSAEILQKVPMLGRVLRYVKRRASHAGASSSRG